MSGILRLHQPTREELDEKCLRPGVPAILTGLMSGMRFYDAAPFAWLKRDRDRIVRAWKSDNADYRYGDKKAWAPARLGEVLDEVSKQAPKMFGVQMPLIKHLWVLEHFPLSMFRRFGSLSDVIQANLWLQGGGNKTHLHFDLASNLHFLIHGRKRFTIFHPSQVERLYPVRDSQDPSFRGEGLNWSLVNVYDVDQARFPLYAAAESITVDMHAGDTLFLPHCFWHYVVTEEASCGINFWYVPEHAGPKPWPWHWYDALLV